ncbi:vegetative cell wall protein gp1-like [Setaria italica]|uniref:vegetative cell wall protein gp1-like n=1 Tax=Setaria italica TaxID=4555 RepID=UPI000350EECF|nr:vegetative cell wall protein gp1-like [Setaria italica]
MGIGRCPMDGAAPSPSGLLPSHHRPLSSLPPPPPSLPPPERNPPPSSLATVASTPVGKEPTSTLAGHRHPCPAGKEPASTSVTSQPPRVTARIRGRRAPDSGHDGVANVIESLSPSIIEAMNGVIGDEGDFAVL